MPTSIPLIVNTAQRNYAGCIVTLVNTETGEVRSRHLGGYDHDVGSLSSARRRLFRRRLGVGDLLRGLCDSLPPEWRVRTICTPQTIYHDLRGRTPPGSSESGAVVPPEVQLLSQLGLIERWEKFEPGSEHRRRLGRQASRHRRRQHGKPDA